MNFLFKKISSILILFLSIFIVIGLIFYLKFDYKLISVAKNVDYTLIHEDKQELDKLYNKLDKKELEIKQNENDFKTKGYLVGQYKKILNSIDNKKKEINKALMPKSKIKLFPYLTKIKSIFIEFIILAFIFVLYYMIIGFIKGIKNNKVIKSVYNINEVKKAKAPEFNKRADIENQNNKKEFIAKEIYTTSPETDIKNKIENNYTIHQKSELSNNTEKKNIALNQSIDYIEELDKMDIKKNETEIIDFENKQSQELKLNLLLKKKEERLKKMLKNPKVEMIASYYKKGESLYSISELTGLSKDEISFVINMWENMVRKE